MSSMPIVVSSFGLFDLALKGTAVMLLAWGLATLLGRASAAWRHGVWCLAVASLLLLPFMSLALPAWRVNWLPQWTFEPAQSAPTEWTVLSPNSGEPIDQETASVSSAAGEPVTVILPMPASAVETDIKDATPLPSSASEESAADTPALPSDLVVETKPEPADPFPWLPNVWVMGGLLSLLPLAIGLGQLSRLKRSSRGIDDPRWWMLLDELRRQMSISRRVQFQESAKVLVPLTWGAFRPVLVVPHEAEAWPDSRRRLVLMHELAHIRRWDWLTQLAAHLACAWYWYNPLVWLASRQMQIERERACDDAVLSTGARASDYAEELLALAAGSSGLRISRIVAVPMARRSALEDRLRGILDSRRNRAALTTAVICLGMAVTFAVMAPLSMLRAAPPRSEESKNEEPKAEEKPAVDKAAPRVAAPDVTDAANGISISVLNATGDKAIAEFRVIAGISAGGIADEFEKRTGRTVINWQPHTCRIGKDGGYVWPLANAYDEMALRVEADGYVPQVFPGIKKANGAQKIVFKLPEDKGIAGRVVTPDRKPAANATVAMALPQQDIVWEDGKLRGQDDPLPEKPGDRWRRSRFLKTDAEGRFELPTETEPAAVLIVHESGVKEMAYDEWKESPEVTLQKWGGIKGQVLWQDKPGADEEVTLTVHRDEYGYPGMIASYGKTQTDNEGKFTFEKVLPGLVQISRPIKPAAPNDTGISAVILNGMFQHAKVVPGDVTPVLLGGRGRTVTGRFEELDSFEGATFHFHPTAPHIGFGGDNPSWKAFGQLKVSPIGPVFFRDKQPINENGTFTIEKMLPGNYQLFLTVPGIAGYAASTQFQVGPEVPGEKPAELKLGEIAVTKKPGAAAPGDQGAAKPAEKPTAKTVTIRGKVVDDTTGNPIERIITQAGKFDPADPKNVTWGYSESRSSNRDGSFSTTVRWTDGWTARVLADGYIPQPVLTAAPPEGKDEVEVVIRLKLGPRIRGVVLDHKGQPLKDAAVFAIGPTGLNLSAGQAVDNDSEAVRTDAEGRFKISIGEAKSLAVSHTTFDAWPAAIPETGDVTIRLPEPATVEVNLDIDGANKESIIFCQLLTEGRKEFAGLRIEREVKMTNPGKLSLAALPPGRYQLCRNVMNNLGEIGMTGMLERQFFELKAGESKAIDLSREKGARLRGQVKGPADTKLMGTIVSIRALVDQKSPFDNFEWPIVYASETCAKDGSFHTERLQPGKYRLLAEAYVPLTPQQRFRSGFIRPSYQVEITIDVPAEGELTLPELILNPTKGDE